VASRVAHGDSRREAIVVILEVTDRLRRTSRGVS
jgi:hypothetical protein